MVGVSRGMGLGQLDLTISRTADYQGKAVKRHRRILTVVRGLIDGSFSFCIFDRFALRHMRKAMSVAIMRNAAPETAMAATAPVLSIAECAALAMAVSVDSGGRGEFGGVSGTGNLFMASAVVVPKTIAQTRGFALTAQKWR